MTNNIQNNTIGDSYTFDEFITLKIKYKELIKENLELKKENNYMKKQLKSIEEYSNSMILLIP